MNDQLVQKDKTLSQSSMVKWKDHKSEGIGSVRSALRGYIPALGLFTFQMKKTWQTVFSKDGHNIIAP